MQQERDKRKQVTEGSEVVLEYHVKLRSGKVVDSSSKSGKARLICGHGDFPKPVEENMLGLAQGESRTIPVPPEMTYGLYDPKKVCLVAIERIAETIEIGKMVKAPDEFGIKRPAIIMKFWDGAALLDFNHPLSGQTLYFEITIEEITENTVSVEHPQLV